MSWAESASTRTLALLRVGFPTLIWATWGTDLVLNYNLVPREFIGAAIVMAASTAMLLGWWSRTASALTGASVAYMLVFSDLPEVPFWPDLHLALMVAVPIVLAFSPCGRSLSFDRYFALARGTAAPESGDARALGVLLALVIGGHVIQALTMSNSAWLSGYTLERMVLWQAVGSVSPGPGLQALLGWLPVIAIVTYVCTWGLALALLYPATRTRAAAVGAVAQLLIYAFFPAGTGPLAFAMLYLAALDPNRVHAFLDGLGGDRP